MNTTTIEKFAVAFYATKDEIKALANLNSSKKTYFAKMAEYNKGLTLRVNFEPAEKLAAQKFFEYVCKTYSDKKVEYYHLLGETQKGSKPTWVREELGVQTPSEEVKAQKSAEKKESKIEKLLSKLTEEEKEILRKALAE